jgi:DNA-binding Lrp family transcriptional regulator
MLKSQDVLIALKLTSLHLRQSRGRHMHAPVSSVLMGTWAGWEADPLEIAEYETEIYAPTDTSSSHWTYATLSKRVGISASECNEAVKRAIACGLLRKSRSGLQPVPIGRALGEFLIHGLKYVFPAEEGTLTRGIPTGFAAPVLSKKLLSAGELIYVWPDARGSTSGLTLYPIHKAVPIAVRYDPILYELIALVDAIRFGKIREVKIASEELKQELENI